MTDFLQNPFLLKALAESRRFAKLYQRAANGDEAATLELKKLLASCAHLMQDVVLAAQDVAIGKLKELRSAEADLTSLAEFAGAV